MYDPCTITAMSYYILMGCTAHYNGTVRVPIQSETESERQQTACFCTPHI